MNDRARFRLSAWVIATTLGWAVGVPAILLLSAVADGMGRESLHSPVGLGMGLAIGAFQCRVLRSTVERLWRWLFAAALGLLTPFLLLDIADALRGELPYSVYLTGLAGGALVAVLQVGLIAELRTVRLRWIVANALGWCLASTSVRLADFASHALALHGLGGALLYLLIAGTGGLFLGGATGIVLARAHHAGDAGR